MSDLLKILVDTGDSSRQIDRLSQAYERLDNATAAYAAKAPSALKQVQEVMKRTGDSDQFLASQENALLSLSNGTAKAVTLVKDQNSALQGLYEARLATAGRLSNAELQLWKSHGASLGKIQAAQLKGFEIGTLLDKVAALSRVESAVHSSAQKLKIAVASYEEAYARLYSGGDAKESPLRSIRVATEQDSAIIAAEMRKFYTQMQSSAEVVAKLGTLTKDNSPLRSIRVATEQDSAAILAGMQKFYADQQRILGNIAATRAATSPLASIRKSTEADSQAILAGMREYYLSQDKSKHGGSRYSSTSFDAAQGKSSAAALNEAKSSTEKLTSANKALSGSFRNLVVDGNNVHSMARGLASSFGLLWLTWGNLIPLFAGAAISSSVKNVVTLGAEVQHTMETIRVLSQETESAVAGLNEQLLTMARSGPFGPQEVAEAMKMLSLAGLSAGEVAGSVQDVLNFAVAGTTDLKTASDVMTSVATAFGIAATGYNYVGDVIAKTAAVSKSSVESIGEAFKTASVVHKQYGASLEDVGVSLAALSNLGIQGTAAGTALRNMYVDLSGRTPKVSKAMKQLGLDLQDQNGRFVDLVTMTQRLSTALDGLAGKDRKKALQTILGERGGKPVIELLDLAERRAKSFSSNVQSELQRLRDEVGNSAGFVANAAIQLAMTPQKQLESISATLKATLVETFAGMEPEILAFSRDMKDLFNSTDFKDGLKTLAVGALDFGRALATVTTTMVEHTKTVLLMVAGYSAARTGLIAYVAYKQRQLALTSAATAATTAETAAVAANSAARLTGLAGLARFLPGVGTVVTVAGLAWAAYEAYVSAAKRSEQGYVDSGYGATIIARLQEETKRIQELNRAKALGLSLDELKAREAVSEGKLESTAARVAAERNLETAKASMAKAMESENRWRVVQEQKKLNLAYARVESTKEVERLQKREVARALEGLKTATEAQKLLNQPPQKDFTGTGTFDSKTQGAPKNISSRNTLDEIIKREREQQAELEATKVVMSEYDKVTVELDKNLRNLEDTYNNILKNYQKRTPEEEKALALQRKEAEALMRGNAELQRNQILAKQEYDQTIARVEAIHKEIVATDELANARYKASREVERHIAEADKKFAFDQSIKYQLPAVQSAEQAKYAVRLSYLEKIRAAEEDTRKQVLQRQYTEDGEFRPDVDTSSYWDTLEKTKSTLNQQMTSEETKAAMKVYQSEWDNVTSQIAGNFTSKFMDGTLDMKDFLIETFANTVLQPQLQLMMQEGFSSLLGGAGGWFSSLLGFPSFEGGGSTGTGPRSGGLDGKGGYLAMVHPDETVIDHTKGGKVSSGQAPVYVTIYNTVGDIATKSMLDQANAATVKQIQAGMARSANYNGAMARG